MLCPISFDCLDLRSYVVVTAIVTTEHINSGGLHLLFLGLLLLLFLGGTSATATSSSAGREGELLNTTRLVNNGSKQRRHGTREVASGLLGNSREGISGNFSVGGSNNDGREGGNEVLLLGSGKVGQR